MDQVGGYHRPFGSHGWAIVDATRIQAGRYERAGNQALVGDLLVASPGMSKEVECPVCHGLAPAAAIVMALNDQNAWTFDQIADWLDGLHNSGAVDLSVDNPEPELIGA